MILSGDIVEVLGSARLKSLNQLHPITRSPFNHDNILLLYPRLRSRSLLGLLVLFAGAVGGRSLPGFNVEETGHLQYENVSQ